MVGETVLEMLQA